MPTEQEIRNLHDSLLATAALIEINAARAAAIAVLLKDKQVEKEAVTAQMLDGISNARFDVNHKLMFTNDDQRKARLIAVQQESADYQAIAAQERTAAQEKAEAETQAELQRKTYRANELLLLYYANNPAA